MSNLFKPSAFFPGMNSFFDDFFSQDFMDWNSKNFTVEGATLPSVNLRETDKEYYIEMAAPGMKKEDFKIELSHNLLTISAEKKDENSEKHEKEHFTRWEYHYSAFKRSFSLPKTAENERIEASYEHGILQVHIAKKEEAVKPVPRIISVK